MSPTTTTISPAKALPLHALITPTEQGIASRVLARTAGGNLTLFAFDPGQGLTEHTSPFDALVLVLEGALTLTIGATTVRATPGTIVRMPADMAMQSMRWRRPECCSSCCVTTPRASVVVVP
jgi:quercetin dioxygenase-like cupin family protein